MIKLFHVHFPGRTVLLAVSEGFLVTATLLAAIFAWSGSDTELALRYEHGFYKIAVAAVVCMVCMYYYDLYDTRTLHSMREVLTRLVQVLGTACVILALVFYAFPAVQLGRGPMLLWIALVGCSVALWRQMFSALLRATGLRQRTMLLGAGPLATTLSTEIEGRPELGLQLVGYVDSGSLEESLSSSLRRLGETNQIAEVVHRDHIGRVILTLGDRRGHLPVEELLKLKAGGVIIDDASDIYEAITGRVPLESLRPSWLLLSPGFQVSHAMRFYKRVASVALSVVGLVISLPLMAVVALAIALDSPGPVIFRQKRVGKDHTIFTCYKFRTMRDGADSQENPRPAQERDERITRVGRWLRRARLDELPQLYNILRGDMCFIGPRPFPPILEDEFAQKIPFYGQRWNVKPGATGWAQVQRGYCTSLEDNIEKLSYDLFYIKNISVGLDFLICLQTIKILLLGRGGR